MGLMDGLLFGNIAANNNFRDDYSLSLRIMDNIAGSLNLCDCECLASCNDCLIYKYNSLFNNNLNIVMPANQYYSLFLSSL